MVVFDEPQLDCEGDGPYQAAVIWETFLLPVSQGEVNDDIDARRRRELRDEALRTVLENPGSGSPLP
jgi:hypothetical protein